jgi:hypothetical protein
MVCQGSCGGGCGPCPTSNSSRVNRSSAPLSAEQIAARQAYAVNEEGLADYDKENWTDAEAAFRECLQLKPGDAVYLRNLALTEWHEARDAYKKDDLATALKYLQLALVNDPPSDKKNNEVIRSDIALVEGKIDAAQREHQRIEQNKKTAGDMHQSIQTLAQSLTAAPSSGGLDFKDSKAAGTAETGDTQGLDFKDSNAATLRDAVSDSKDSATAARVKKIQDMNALAKRLGWSQEKQARLNAALNKLGFDGEPGVTGGQIKDTWEVVVARGQDAELMREAAQGGGLGFPGAGTQTVNNDCVVFALATATNLPYGVVAARATKLIREATWLDAGERANPQEVIERTGMGGEEVVMLAESFGRAEVVSSSDFAKNLIAGRPIMVDVVPADGDVTSGHEVVLIKTFQHRGETWFVMMDSNQGPQRRLFLSSKELNIMLQENGVSFRPEPASTPKLLH